MAVHVLSLQVLENRVDATKSCLEIALMIKAYGKKVVHPNHYLMFRLWDKLYFTSFKVRKAFEPPLKITGFPDNMTPLGIGKSVIHTECHINRCFSVN